MSHVSEASDGAVFTTRSAASPALITSAQAADRLGVSQRMVWELAKRGDLPVVKIGRAVRFDPLDIEQFVAAAKR